MIQRKDRAGIRQSFVNKANQKQTVGELSSQSALLSRINDTQIEAFNSLLRYLDGKTTKTEVVNQLEEIGTPDVLKLLPKLDKLEKGIIAAKLDIKPVVDAVNALKRETTLLPTKMPRPDKVESVKVSNLDEIKLDTSAVEKAIKGLDLSVKVDAPVINTEKTDIEPLRKLMLDMVKAINKIEIPEVKFPEIPKTDLTKVEKKLDESNKHLKVISEKKFSGGGGGGGNGTPYIDATGKPVNVVLTSQGNIPIEGTLTSAAGVTYKYYNDGSDATYDYLAKQGSDGSWWINRQLIAGGPVEYAVGSSDIATAWTNKAAQTYADWDTNNQAEAAMVTESDVHITGDSVGLATSAKQLADNHNVTVSNPTADPETGLAKDATLTDGTQVVNPYFTTGTGTKQVPRLNPQTHVLNTMDYAHHEIHNASSYFYTDSVELNANGVTNYLLTTPNTTAWAHMTFKITGSAITQIQVYEATDKTGTTQQTVFNHDRNSTNTDGTIIHKAISGGTTDGTLIWQRKSGSATAQSRAGDEASHGMEIILKQNTKYIFRVTSGTNANLTNVLFDWYSHTNRSA